MADRKITMTPPLTAVAQEAEAIGLGFTALLTADIARARTLARRAAQALALADDDLAAIAAALDGVEAHEIVAGIDDLPGVGRIVAELHNGRPPRPDVARRLVALSPSPLAIWGLFLTARQAARGKVLPP